MRYPLKACEREVTIRFDMEERVAHIYTSEPVYMRRLDKLVETLPEIYKCVKVDELGYFKKYECPMKLMNPRRPRILTDEQKAGIVARFKKAPDGGVILDIDDSGEDFIEDDMPDEET